MEWDESLSVGIPEIDVEHQCFIRLINELNEAISSRMGLEEIKKRLRLILEDAASHFAHEEALFKEWKYPEVAEHAIEHEQMIIAMNKIIARFEHDCTEYELVEAVLDIKAALIEHLLAEDMKYCDYYQQKESLQTE
jgi:hemerythrin-like metal-binding protein